MPEEKNLTLLKEQQKVKPNIEDVIPLLLEGEMLETALDFVTYLQANRMNPVWAGVHNSWKVTYKGKCLFYIRLCVVNPSGENKKWVINPYLINIDKYDESVINEGLQDYIWDNVYYCKFCRTPCHGHSPGEDITLLGKEIKSVCRGRQPVWFYDPDETTINQIKKLLDFEKQVRKFANKKKVMELSCPSKCQIDNLQDESRAGVLKITNPDNWAVVYYNLNKYKGHNITINFSIDVKRVGAAGTLIWQVNNEDYPSVGIPINNVTADTWHTMSGEWSGTLTADFPTLFLSTHENNSSNTTYYIDNFNITITPT